MNKNHNQPRSHPRNASPPKPSVHSLRGQTASAPCDPGSIRIVGSALPPDLQAPYWTITLLGLRSSNIDAGGLRYDDATGLVGIVDGKDLRVLPTPPAVRPWLDTATVDGTDRVRFERSNGAPVTRDRLARIVRSAAATSSPRGAVPVTVVGLRKAAVQAAISRGVDTGTLESYFGLTREAICIDCLSEVADAMEGWYQSEFHPARA